MLSLDTEALPEHERADAITAIMREIALATNVVHEDPADVFMSTWVWDLGPVELVHTERSGLYMDVTVERDDQPPVLALMLGSRLGGRREQFGHLILEKPGVVDMIELNRPHRSWVRRGRDGWVVKIPVDALALPSATVTRARSGLTSTPMQQVFANHFRSLVQVGPDLAGDPSAAQVGVATLALARALIGSAGEDETRTREALHESLLVRMQGFVREHLRDPGLSAASIAAAHRVSVRLVYRVYADAGLQLEQSIIDQRLDGARWELTQPTGRRRSVAAVAHQWGFASPSHFNRRFKDKFGMTPGEWQRLG